MFRISKILKLCKHLTSTSGTKKSCAFSNSRENLGILKFTRRSASQPKTELVVGLKPGNFHFYPLGLFARSKNTGNVMPEKTSFERLPKNVVPSHYDICLKPDLKKLVFDGTAAIRVKVISSTQTVVVNSLEITYTKVEFKHASGTVHKAADISIREGDEVAVFTFESALPVGEGEMRFQFHGILNDKMKGFYRSKYTTPDGQERYSATTQFEPTYARRAFPCWDEPALKATFDMTLIVPKDRVALSNMNVISEKPTNEDLLEVKFATSPIMSTYLLACIVGEFDYVEDRSSDGVKVRVYTPVGKKEQGVYALEVATKALPFYKDYFNIAYPLPKMDLVAIADFASGAMENWGLVTYRESCVLVDSQNTSADRRQVISLMVGHELAHQWFGNLVTMEWWTHLWLNEGFATFIEFPCVDHLFPEYEIWTQFVTDTYNRALELDALNNSHPIEVPVGHPNEIDEIFDEISYNKGASVIRMLHRYIGDDNFKKGMNLYLTRHAYKNTQTEDLWLALQEASKLPVASVMSTWTKQKGFPVISVSSKQDGNNRILTISQEKFCADGEDKGNNYHWMAPINIISAANPTEIIKSMLLDTTSIQVVLENINKDHWIKVNPGTVEFYRVLYTPEMMAQLLPSIRDRSLPPMDRLGLQNDVFAMVQAGKCTTVEILKLMEAFINETNYNVWVSINSCLAKLNTLVSHTDYDPLFHTYGRRLLAKIHSKLGWEPIKGESHLDTLLRSLVIGRLITFQDEEVLAEAKKRFDAHASGVVILPADLRNVVYRAAASVGDDRMFELMLKMYREADLHEEKDRISWALGAVKDEGHVRRVLEFSISDDVRSQDSIYAIASVASTKQGREMSWQFFQEKHDYLRKRYEGGYLIAQLVKYVTKNFASEEKAQEVDAFFTKNSFPSAERTVQQSLETIRLNARWLARDSDSVKSYLSTNC